MVIGEGANGGGEWEKGAMKSREGLKSAIFF